jgi:hypothetical protein
MSQYDDEHVAIKKVCAQTYCEKFFILPTNVEKNVVSCG